MRLIDADALLDDVFERYCKECDKRRGIKNGKYRIVYNVGDAPCRACSVDDMRDDLENAPTIEERKKGKWEIEKALKLLSQQLIWMYDDGKISYEVCLELSSKLIDIAEMVRGEEIEERKKGEWIRDEKQSKKHIEPIFICSACRAFSAWGEDEKYNYCPNCGADMRGEEDEMQ